MYRRAKCPTQTRLANQGDSHGWLVHLTSLGWQNKPPVHDRCEHSPYHIALHVHLVFWQPVSWQSPWTLSQRWETSISRKRVKSPWPHLLDNGHGSNRKWTFKTAGAHARLHGWTLTFLSLRLRPTLVQALFVLAAPLCGIGSNCLVSSFNSNFQEMPEDATFLFGFPSINACTLNCLLMFLDRLLDFVFWTLICLVHN